MLGVITAVTVLGVTATVSAAASLTNPGFETGDLTGWVHNGNGSAVASWGAYTAPEDGWFAVTSTSNIGGDSNPQVISQEFVASSGDVISGWAFFATTDYLPFNDSGTVRIVQGDEIVFFADVSMVGNGGSTTWTPWSWTASSDGTYTLEASVANIRDNVQASTIGIDLVDCKTKGCILGDSGVDGNGIKNAPGLDKEFNPKSQAAHNAGKK